MRALLWFFILEPLALAAQPSPPDVSFTIADDALPLQPFSRPCTVWLAGITQPLYGRSDGVATPFRFQLPLIAPAAEDGVPDWPCYTVRMDAHTHVRITIIAGSDSMVLLLPDALDERWKFVQRVMARSHADESPEVVRFRPGRSAFAEVITDAEAERVAILIAEERQRRKEHAWRRAHVADAMAERGTPPAVRTPSIDPSAGVSLGKVRRADVEQAVFHRDSTVYLRLTGTVALDGGCSSDKPMFGLEERKANGWEERLAVPQVQMDCGLPSITWTDHRIGLQLTWWLKARAPANAEGSGAGTYRLVFLGGGGELFRTKPFKVR